MIIAISGKIGSGKDTIGDIIRYFMLMKVTGVSMSYNQYLELGYDEDAHDWKVKKFADKLKDIVCLLLNCTRKQLEHNEFKNKELGEEWYRVRLYINDKLEGIYLSEAEIKEKYQSKIYEVGVKIDDSPLTPRLLLQLLGTDCGRNIIHPNIWVSALMADYRKTFTGLDAANHFVKNDGTSMELHYPNWIITDMRFPNELKAVENKNGVSIRVIRNNNSCVCVDDSSLTCLVNCNKKPQHESETALDNASFKYTIHNNGSIEDLINIVERILKKEKLI